MKIAVTYENDMIFQHFGHTKKFKLYEIENNLIVNEKIIDTDGSGHSALASVLKTLNADILICGGIGGCAKTALDSAGIKLYGGVSGACDDAVKALLNNTLSYNSDATCSHHSHSSHSCGENCN